MKPIKFEKFLNDTLKEVAPNPNKRLWFAVYIQAVREACSENEKTASVAKRWLTDPKSEKNTGGVLYVCAVTGINYHQRVLQLIKNGTPEEKQALKKALT